jgi:hypothetical protein
MAKSKVVKPKILTDIGQLHRRTTAGLREEVLRMAKEHEESWMPRARRYAKSIADCVDPNNAWSFPAFLMLSMSWNDVLDWANGNLDDKIEAPNG